MKSEFLQYGAIGLMAFIFFTGLIIIAKHYNKLLISAMKEKDKQIEELKAAQRHESDTILQFLRNQNQLIENQNNLVKGFIDISTSFKALVNVMVERH